jgi:hypothetical protein
MPRKQAEIDADKAKLLEQQKTLESEIADETASKEEAERRAKGATLPVKKEQTEIARASEDSLAALYERLGEVKALLEGKGKPALEGEEPPKEKSFFDSLWGD